MAAPRLTPDQITQVSELVAHYINAQRERYSPCGIVLSSQQKVAMTGFFSPRLLNLRRVVVLQGERIESPDFYPALKKLGFENLPDQTAMAAITFSDVVISHGPFSNGLLFHELVHVEQYHQLGIPRFSELYVRGFLKGGSYEAIPLEVNAYTLGARFEDYPAQQFWVADDVRKWIEKDRY
jgi:hypothetical protein